MKPFVTGLAAAALLATWSAPADAHIVYFKDGTVVRGTVVMKEASLTIKGPDAELSFPLSTVRAISFTDEPIGYEQHPVEESKVLNSDALLWTAVAANLAAIVVAAVTLLPR